MPFDQYHEPFDKLPEETRTFARLIVSMIEEADAINWYEQRMSVEADEEAKQVMSHAQQEEFIHFGMDLEFLLRRDPHPHARAASRRYLSGFSSFSSSAAEESNLR